jgi:DNA primase
MIGENEPVDRLLPLLEGEPDCIRSWSLGVPAVAVPGAGNWKPEWAWRLRSRRWTIAITFDCDAAGRAGALRVADDLVNAGVDARIVNLDPARNDGYDLTDWTRHE